MEIYQELSSEDAVLAARMLGAASHNSRIMATVGPLQEGPPSLPSLGAWQPQAGWPQQPSNPGVERRAQQNQTMHRGEQTAGCSGLQQLLSSMDVDLNAAGAPVVPSNAPPNGGDQNGEDTAQAAPTAPLSLTPAASLSQPIITGIDHRHALLNGLSDHEVDEDELDFLTAGSREDEGLPSSSFLLPFTQPSGGGAPRANSQQLGYKRSGSLGIASHGPSAGPGGPSVLILAVKGPGDSLGLTSLAPNQPASEVGAGAPAGVSAPTSPTGAAAGVPRPLPPLGRSTDGGCLGRASGDHRPTWRANVRARGEVVAFMANMDNIQRLVQLHPELAATMKHMATQQETDLMVSEALRQLRLVSAGLNHHDLTAMAAQEAQEARQQHTSREAVQLPVV